ncbi:hypothetical protein D3C80_993460 [compost metagenome]
MITVIGQNDLNKIFTNIMYVTFNSRQQYFTFDGGLIFLHEVFQVSNRGFHHLRTLEHFRYDQLVVVEQTPNFLHPSH